MLLSLQKTKKKNKKKNTKQTNKQTNNQTNKQQQNTQKQQQHIVAPVYITEEMLSGNCSEGSTGRAYIPYPTVTIVK